MKVSVWKVKDWAQSKHSSHEYRRVMLKRLDNNETVYLNLTKNTSISNWSYWDKYLKEGNVLDVVINPNTGNVNQFEPFTIIDIKDKNKEDIELDIC